MLYSEQSAHRQALVSRFIRLLRWPVVEHRGHLHWTPPPVQVGADPVLTTTLMTHLNAYADTRKHFVMVSSKKHV
jgi:hypothetical protein